jgi:RNA polymerase sigma-70 factor (ECF subfamily)
MTLRKNRNEPAGEATSQAVPGQPADSSDFESVFQRNWTRIWRLLARLTGDPDEAEDLALEAFERLYHEPLRDPAASGGWLYRTATHLGLNALRARRRRQQYEQAGGLAAHSRPDGDPAEVVEAGQEREQVRAALEKMKPRSAQLLLLRHSGLSYAEIAAALNVAPGSIGVLLVRAEAEFESIYGKGEAEYASD